MVSGGQVSNTSNFNNSVNPGWRTALLHMVLTQGWLDTTPAGDREYVIGDLRRKVKILDRLSTIYPGACYWNEADPGESDWQQKFFGTRSNYDTLKSIKQIVDPDGLFI